MTEKQSEEWDNRVLITTDGRSYWVSRNTQEDFLKELTQDRLIPELIASATLRRLFYIHGLLEVET